MFIENLDRHQWTLDQAKKHIGRLILTWHHQEAIVAGETPKPARRWPSPDDPIRRSEDEAHSELFTALRDGDLHATGRLSEQRRPRYATGYSSWDFHSGNHQPISPSHWREGQFGYGIGSLEFLRGEFIDIRVPRFMVLAIWPEPRIEESRNSDSEAPYTTPYIEMMFTAIRVHGITEEQQSKKELLADWFTKQKVEGELISGNLGDAMATLIRLPQSQRGGAKRMIGPDVRETV